MLGLTAASIATTTDEKGSFSEKGGASGSLFKCAMVADRLACSSDFTATGSDFNRLIGETSASGAARFRGVDSDGDGGLTAASGAARFRGVVAGEDGETIGALVRFPSTK
jgi:hypothetical protein